MTLLSPSIEKSLSPRAEHYRNLITVQKLLKALGRDQVAGSIRGVGDWLDAASTATGIPGKCYRTAMLQDDGEIEWLYPNSNTSELISTWLDLEELFPGEGYQGKAVAYAEHLVADPIKGLYRGEYVPAHGLAWYWRDDGTYTGGYSMRAPDSFRRLHQVTGDSRYLEATEMIGQTFLQRQLDSGLVSMVGWDPNKGWIHPKLMGCRYFYTIATFATLYQMTGKQAYVGAYEKSVAALQKLQNPDGSFFQCYDPETLEAQDPSIKLHFFSYILNALAEAYPVFKDERVLESARKIGDYLAGGFYYRQQTPYCEYPYYSTDKAEADSATQDNANGLFWLYEVTREELYLDMAVKLWLQAWTTQIDAPDRPGWHGAIVRGMKPDMHKLTEQTQSRHLTYDPQRLARCEVWFMTNHVFASKRLLALSSP